MSVTTNLSGLQREIKAGGRRAERFLKDEIERAGRLTESGAVTDVPVDTGALRASISYEPTSNGFGALITANVPYAAYVEFGTGGSVLIPTGWETVAANFRGAGGRSFSMPPRPYLIPNFNRQKQELMTRLRAFVTRQ